MKKLIALAALASASLSFAGAASAGSLTMTFGGNGANYETFSANKAVLVESVSGGVYVTTKTGAQIFMSNSFAWSRMMASPEFQKNFAQINSNKWVNGTIGVRTFCAFGNTTSIVHEDGSTQNLNDGCAAANAINNAKF